MAFNALAAEGSSIDSIIAKNEKAKTKSSGKMNRSLALKALRGQKSISQEDYRHVKGSSASQAALATDLHAHGIKGNGVTIWLLEDSGVNGHLDVLKFIDPSSDIGIAPGFTQKQDHGAAMASLAHQMAPEARLVLKHLKGYVEALHHVPEKPFIINASFNTGDVDIDSYFGPVFAVDGAFKPLVVNSAGNDGVILSEDSKYKDLSSDLRNHLIIVGNLRQDGRPRASSGIPGENKTIQDRFLWVIADDMLAAGGPTGVNAYRYATGTSGAAAILSGAAALIKSRYPHFTMKDVAECLLESANRDLFSLFGDGYHALHVVKGPEEVLREPVRTEEESKAAAGSSTLPSRIQIRTIMYAPAQWGKGVLNVKNAMAYADLKSKLSSEKPESLRRRMLGSIALKETWAARKIQQWWRTNKKSIPEAEKPLPLVVDKSISGRTYPEADGEYKGKTIPEPDPKEAGKSQGLSYEEGGEVHHKTPAEIRAARERLKASTKGIVEELREGITTLDAIKEELTKKPPKELVEWLYANQDILSYKVNEEPFLSYILQSYDWNIRDTLLQGLTENFKEQYKVLIDEFIHGLSSAGYLYFSTAGALKEFIEMSLNRKEWFGEESIGKLLLSGIKIDEGNREYYAKFFKESGFDPLSIKTPEGSTIMHLIGRDGEVFDHALNYYIGKGIPGGELLNAKSERGVTPFGMVAERLGYSPERNIEGALHDYMGKGGRFIKGMYQEAAQMTDVSIFIRQQEVSEEDRYDSQYDVVSFDAIKKSFLSLKDRAFIFDIEGVDKSLESLSVYGIPDPVSALLQGECSSSADWRAKVDGAWAEFERFLKAGDGKVYKDWSGVEKPCMLRDKGKIFYNTGYDNWPKG